VPAGAGFDCSLDLAAAPLAAGESRPLIMALVVPEGPQICEARNQASIKAPVGGSDANSNAGNDVTAVITQVIPLAECNPPQTPQSNLVITKTGIGCELSGSTNLTAVVAPPSGVVCGYQVTVTNAGPGDVNEEVGFNDAAFLSGAPTIVQAGGQPGWVCAAAGPVASCTNPAGMPAGASATFNVQVTTTRAMVRDNQCQVVNQAWISQPVGAPLNGIAADDLATAAANGPVNICTDVPNPQKEVCAIERQMPDQGCCPDGQRWNGKSCSGGTTPPKLCPSGTTGTYPDCRKIITKKCPSGTTGNYPDCRKITIRFCPSDSDGKYPNCVCKRGTFGEPGNCQRKQCPNGTVGKWPNCQTVSRLCPKGTVGKWPNCAPITRKCPRGTYGEWPNCYKPGGTNNTTPDTNAGTPNTNCPDGYVFSDKVKTCVQKKRKSERRKQQEQIQQQQPVLQSPILKVDPNLLQQQ
jgi:hypothetical protein